MSNNGKGMSMNIIRAESFPINEELAGVVPMACEAEQQVLTADIMSNGLREPVKLWRKQIVDGRCRQKACLLAGIPVDATELDDSLTEDEVRVYVKSVNTRRNLTHTQKTLTAAYEAMRPTGPTVVTAAKAWAVSKVLVHNAIYIINNQPDIATTLFNGGAVNIVSKYGKEVTTNKVSAVYAHLRRLAEDVKESTEHGWEANGYIKTQAGKDWYYDKVNSLGVRDVATQMMVAELANYKFSKNKKDV